MVLTSSLLVLSCAPGGGEDDRSGGDIREGNGDRPATASSQTRDLRLTLTAGRASYQKGKPILFSLTLENRTDEPVVVNWNSGQHFETAIEDASGKEVYRWSRGMAFTQALEERTLEPGQTDRLEATWDQKDPQGKQVASGTYTVTGSSTASQAPSEVSLAIRIEG